MKTKIRKKKCIICWTQIEVYKETHGTNKYCLKARGSQSCTDSDEGTFFTYEKTTGGCWFCNQCWGKILRYRKWNKKT